jgi:uncharacterized membrane protein YcaP (DUF421 family)
MTWWQMSIRAVIIFLFGLVLVRLASKRVFGRWGAIDIILSVIIGSNLSRTMTGSAPFLETLAATTVLVALHAVVVWVAARVSWLGPLVKGKSCRIAQDGRFDPRQLKKHAVGDRDIEEALHFAGLARPDQVAEAWIERNGDISIIKR